MAAIFGERGRKNDEFIKKHTKQSAKTRKILIPIAMPLVHSYTISSAHPEKNCGSEGVAQISPGRGLIEYC